MKFVLLFTLMLSSITLYSCKAKDDGTAPSTVDVNIPTFSTPVTFSSKTSTSFTISWVGTDNSTAAADLSYKVVYSGTNNITTAIDAEASGVVLMNWSTNILTANMTSLAQSTNYYVSVLAKDSEGNIGISAGSTNTLCSGKIMFLVNVPNGNFGGASGADTICNGNKPAGFAAATFKAMLTDISTRRACYVLGNDNCSGMVTGRLDWPLPASASICTTDYSARIGTTTSSALLNANGNTLSTVGTTTYTGFNVAWGSSATNCSNFASTGGTGIVGSANGVTGGTNTFIASSIPSCATAGTIYCVQQ